MGIVLLFHVDVVKTGQIVALCRRLGHEVTLVPQSDYGKSLGVLAKVSGMKSEAVYTGSGFSDEMMVFSGMDSDTLDQFLCAYKEDNISPIPRKAMLTPSNVMWSAEKLYRELEEHVAKK